MNKLQMAHDYAMQLSKNTSVTATHNDSDIVARAWKYVDEMQAEADKRENKWTCIHDWNETTSNGDKYRFFVCKNCDATRNFEPIEEWQPDWSQAPDWANWWAMDGFSYSANWYRYEPVIDSESEDEDEWNIGIKAGETTYLKAPSFNYKGDWRKSLRKRPQ